MRLRILVLPIAAAVLTALAVYRLSQPRDTRTFVPPPLKKQAPLFALYDQSKPPKLVRLDAFIGRHPIVLVFFDGEAGANSDPYLVRLRKHDKPLEADGLKVIGVSTALPQENRPLAQHDPRRAADARDRTPFPFPLLTDEQPDRPVHRLWGRYDDQSRQTLAGVFFIDRAGLVGWQDKTPQPIPDPDVLLDRLVGADRHK